MSYIIKYERGGNCMKNNSLLIRMGERIAERRKALKMTQEELAEKIDVSIPMISNLEQGKKAIRPENLVKICSVLGLSADYILMGKTITEQDYIALFEGVEALDYDEIKLVQRLIEYMNSKK